jgi:hypothetical protein
MKKALFFFLFFGCTKPFYYTKPIESEIYTHE